jgi:hypothetical protein
MALVDYKIVEISIMSEENVRFCCDLLKFLAIREISALVRENHNNITAGLNCTQRPGEHGRLTIQ